MQSKPVASRAGRPSAEQPQEVPQPVFELPTRGRASGLPKEPSGRGLTTRCRERTPLRPVERVRLGRKTWHKIIAHRRQPPVKRAHRDRHRTHIYPTDAHRSENHASRGEKSARFARSELSAQIPAAAGAQGDESTTDPHPAGRRARATDSGACRCGPGVGGPSLGGGRREAADERSGKGLPGFRGWLRGRLPLE